MNWYKSASLIDTVQTVSCDSNRLVIMVNGKMYEYTNVPGQVLFSEIDRLKKWKNKFQAGQKMSAMLKNLEKNLVQKQPNKNLIGDCRDDSLVEDIFGSVSEFARQVEENGDSFQYGRYAITYDPRTDIHYFYE